MTSLVRPASLFALLIAGVVVTLAVLAALLTAPSAGLRMTASTDKVFYGPGERVHIALHLTNTGAATVELHFSSSCQAAFTVEDFQGNPVFDSSLGAGCFLVLTHLTLAPGGSQDFTFTWDQTSSSGPPVPAGEWYRVHGSLWGQAHFQADPAMLYIKS